MGAQWGGWRISRANAFYLWEKTTEGRCIGLTHSVLNLCEFYVLNFVVVVVVCGEWKGDA